MGSTWNRLRFHGAELAEVRLRLATEIDWPTILAMVLDPSTLAGIDESPGYVAKTLRRLWYEEPETSGLRHFVVERAEDGEVIAYLRLEYPLFEPKCLWMTFFVVAPGMRGQGHGRRIMELLKGEAQRSGCVAKFGVHTSEDNAPATGLYRAMGFKCVKREPWESSTGRRTQRLTFCWTPANAAGGAT